MFFATAGFGVKVRRFLAFTGGLLFLVFWQIFDADGGFYNLGGTFPSPSALWIIIPSIQAATFGSFIACAQITDVIQFAPFRRLAAR